MRRRGWSFSRRPSRSGAPTSRIRTRSSRRSPSVHSLRRSWSPVVVSSHRPSIAPSAKINWSTQPSWSRKRSMTSSTFHRYCIVTFDYHDVVTPCDLYTARAITNIAAKQNSCNILLNYEREKIDLLSFFIIFCLVHMCHYFILLVTRWCAMTMQHYKSLGTQPPT